jgi:hypothetical protein
VRAKKQKELLKLATITSRVPTLADVECLTLAEATSKPQPRQRAATPPTWPVGPPTAAAPSSIASPADDDDTSTASFSFASLAPAAAPVAKPVEATSPTSSSSTTAVAAAQQARGYASDELDLRSFVFHAMKRCCSREPARRPSFETLLADFHKYLVRYDATFRRLAGIDAPSRHVPPEFSNSDGYIVESGEQL